jgi:hypothetical protein
MFDTVFGLPMHVLMVHAAVIGLPLIAIVTAVVAARPAWRARWSGGVAALDVAALALVLVTRQSGLTFFERLSRPEVAERHRELADILLWIVVGLAVLGVLTWAAQRTSRVMLASGLAVLLAVAALATVVQTVATGHSGSTAVWKGTVDSTEAP